MPQQKHTQCQIQGVRPKLFESNYCEVIKGFSVGVAACVEDYSDMCAITLSQIYRDSLNLLRYVLYPRIECYSLLYVTVESRIRELCRLIADETDCSRLQQLRRELGFAVTQCNLQLRNRPHSLAKLFDHSPEAHSSH